MPLSVYTRLTNLIAVRDVLTPIQAYIDQSCNLNEAVEEFDRRTCDTSLPFLVRDGGRVVGAVRYWDLRSVQEEAPIGEIDERGRAGIHEGVSRIDPDQLVTADTKLWRAAHALIRGHPHDPLLFVLDGDEITGTFTFHDLFKPPFLVCLFALTVEIENAALQLCSRDASASWAALSPGRQTRALRSLEFAQKKRQPANKAAERIDNIRKHPLLMLEYTCFIDKKEMILKRDLLPKEDQRWLEAVFNAAEELRNRCAHPDSSGEPFIAEPQELLKRIEDCHNLLAKIKLVTEAVDETEL